MLPIHVLPKYCKLPYFSNFVLHSMILEARSGSCARAIDLRRGHWLKSYGGHYAVSLN